MKVIFLDFNGTIDKPYRSTYFPEDFAPKTDKPEDGAFGAEEDLVLAVSSEEVEGRGLQYGYNEEEIEERIAIVEEALAETADYDEHGLDKDGYDKDGYDLWGYDKEGFDCNGADIKGFTKNGYHASMYRPSMAGIEHFRNIAKSPERRVHYPIFSGYSDSPNPDSIGYLKALVDNTGAKIVYSTTRRHSGVRSCMDYIGLPPEYSLGDPYFGVTPTTLTKKKVSAIEWFRNKVFKKRDTSDNSWKPRQREIQAWLDQWEGEKIESYVILDDDEITDPEMAKHWVSSVSKNRFLGEEYEEALNILLNKKA
jgi:hypothetical protein